jgi:rod shape-determining protein MreC
LSHVFTLRKTIVLLLVFVVVSFGLVVLDRNHQLDLLKGFAARVVDPVQIQLGGFGRAVGGFSNLFTDSSQIRDENQQLKAAVEYLTAENARMVELERENEELRKQLGFKQAHPTLIGLPVEVIGREPSGTIYYIMVDKGKTDGVKKGMPVVDSAGLVGQVIDVDDGQAKILLITDISSSIPAKIQSSRADGIVEGEAQRGGTLTMKYIQQGEKVQAGDWVITSGLGGTFPKGLPIGKVINVRQKDSDMMQDADVAPVVSFSRLESVTIVLGEQ